MLSSKERDGSAFVRQYFIIIKSVNGGLLGVRRMDRVPNAQIRELCGVRKGLDERIDESVLW